MVQPTLLLSELPQPGPAHHPPVFGCAGKQVTTTSFFVVFFKYTFPFFKFIERNSIFFSDNKIFEEIWQVFGLTKCQYDFIATSSHCYQKLCPKDRDWPSLCNLSELTRFSLPQYSVKMCQFSRICND